MLVAKRVVRIISYIATLIALFFLILCCFHDDSLIIRNYTYDTVKVQTNFRIVVYSDFHHRDLKFPNADIIEETKKLNPNIVVFCGDMIDSHTKNLDNVNKIMDGLRDFPIYYVTGNHEEYAPLFNDFKEEIKRREQQNQRVYFIDDKQVNINDNITLYGLHDPIFDSHTYSNFRRDYGKLEETINKNFTFDAKKFNILLAHRPELADLYVRYPFDMIISGHSHGGQIRFGDFSFFRIATHTPYDHGEYIINDKRLYVSSGLGYSAMLPIRINCNPELVSIDVK